MVFWPAKLQAAAASSCSFEFWDCGESALKKFEHMLRWAGRGGPGGLGAGASEPGLRGLQAPGAECEAWGRWPSPGAAAAAPGLHSPAVSGTGGGKTSWGRQLLVPGGRPTQQPLTGLPLPRLARRTQTRSSSSSPSLTGPPLKTSLDSWRGSRRGPWSGQDGHRLQVSSEGPRTFKRYVWRGAEAGSGSLPVPVIGVGPRRLPRGRTGPPADRGAGARGTTGRRGRRQAP